MISLTIDKKPVELIEKKTILEAAAELGIKIPTLCHNSKLKPYGGCRTCLVEVATSQNPERSRLVPACTALTENDMVVYTDTDRVKSARAFIIELLVSRAPESDEMREMALSMGVDVKNAASLGVVGRYLIGRAPRIEPTNCILCSCCVRVCAEITERHAISFAGRGMARKVKTPFERYADSCIGCGACAYVCPTNTITIEEVT